mmetsp:Transcript_12913/g.18995  ORF Transcript_12913/g.18995 Transcript_12913/m.18995 type:complete len:610 (-) Transcript_12913:346-2175(-)
MSDAHQQPSAVPRLLGKLLDQKSSVVGDAACSPGGVSQSTMNSLALVILGGGVASFLRTTSLSRAEDSIASSLRSKAFTSLLMLHDLEWFQFEGIREESDSEMEDKDAEKSDELNVKSEKMKEGDTDLKKKPTAAYGMTPGAIGAILNEDVTKVANAVTGNLANLIRSSCSCIFGAYHMLRLNPSLFGLSFGVVPLIGTAAIVLRKFIKKFATKQREVATLAAAFAEEKLTHVAMVKMSNRELDEVERFSKLQNEAVALGRRVSLANGVFMGFIFAASSGALFMVFNAGGKAVATGRMTAGELTSFTTYTFLLGLGTSGIFKALGEITHGMICAERVYRLVGLPQAVEKKEDVRESTSHVDVSSITSISLKDVEFSYKANINKKVLKCVSLKIRRGEVVCVVGKNGSGKTTIASLLAALYKPQAGSMTLSDGTNYTSLDRQIQKKLVQVVPQSPVLFNATILENVRYSNPSASVDEVQRAMKLANCDFVDNLEGQLEYCVGPNGSKLSGGQQQRLGIARALLSDPCILVLDEPTSALDFEGEGALADAVQACRAGPGKGLLLITHRQKTLQLSDKVVVLKEGNIVESGSFDALSENKESELCKLMPDLM